MQAGPAPQRDGSRSCRKPIGWPGASSWCAHQWRSGVGGQVIQQRGRLQPGPAPSAAASLGGAAFRAMVEGFGACAAFRAHRDRGRRASPPGAIYPVGVRRTVLDRIERALDWARRTRAGSRACRRKNSGATAGSALHRNTSRCRAGGLAAAFLARSVGTRSYPGAEGLSPRASRSTRLGPCGRLRHWAAGPRGRAGGGCSARSVATIAPPKPRAPAPSTSSLSTWRLAPGDLAVGSNGS